MTGSSRGPNDPGRRDRIIDAALELVAERGVVSVTYRSVAQAAAVPLGSVTYYFGSLQQLLCEAFTRLAESESSRYGALLERARTPQEAREAVVEIICGQQVGNERELLLSYELYAFAARNPELRSVMRSWMQASRAALSRHFDTRTARALDALIEGLIIHNSVDEEPTSREDIAVVVEAITG
ncbi:TetR family transcriptional regulator [Streptomyces sp. NPDC042319]|uniref:TetR/AcrR family transcriptional regulator n=1 Tax=Streptomyces sp. NPDC042319 TaxID=3154332 RepID=UPI0033E58F1C